MAVLSWVGGGGRGGQGVLGVMILAAFAPHAAASDLEDPATAVLDIARFASWPEEADYGLSFRICLRDDDPAFARFVALREETVGGRPVSIHGLAPVAFQTRPCHVAYFSDGLAEPRLLVSLAKRPILTVSPQKGFAASGLVELEGKKLVVDRRRAGAHKVRLSAQLLAMAKEASR